MTSPQMVIRPTLTFGSRLMLLVKTYSIDIPLDKMCEVDGWAK
jgi:hypothetical protein